MQFSLCGTTSLVIDLFDEVDPETLAVSLDALLQQVTKVSSYPALDDWRVVFQLVFNGGITDIRVYHRQNSDPKRKEKWVTIHVPIPSVEQVPWGVPTQTIITLKTVVGGEKWYRAIPSNLLTVTLQEHCFLASHSGIIHALTTGITVKGHKVQLEPSLLEY